MKIHYVIPFFIPHRGCPYRCIFCNQNRLTSFRMTSPADIVQTVNRYLSTIPLKGVHVEVGFFGGTFTGLPIETQEQFLKCVQPFLYDIYLLLFTAF